MSLLIIRNRLVRWTALVNYSGSVELNFTQIGPR